MTTSLGVLSPPRNGSLPYARNATNFLYADAECDSSPRTYVSVTKPAMGEKRHHLGSERLTESSLIRSLSMRRYVAPSPLQTYLDLTKGGDRGLEAAEHLREAKLKWPK